jgi:hypothetical protein
MRFLELNQRRIALICTMILVVLLIIVFVRQNNIGQVHDTTSSTKKPETLTKQKVVAAPQPTNPTTESLKKTETSKKTDEVYTYVAQPGDSYTLLTRAAIQQYTQEKNISLSAEQLLTAEVSLVNAAGAPELALAQEVTIDPKNIVSTVSNAVNPASTTPSTTDNTSANSSEQTAPENKFTESSSYSYTAQPGDSYTLLARDTIKQHTSKQNITLSPEQAVAAETFVVEAAGAPSLEVGQKVIIANEAIVLAVTEVQKLTAEEQANWSAYSAVIKF